MKLHDAHLKLIQSPLQQEYYLFPKEYYLANIIGFRYENKISRTIVTLISL